MGSNIFRNLRVVCSAPTKGKKKRGKNPIWNYIIQHTHRLAKTLRYVGSYFLTFLRED